MEQTGKIEKRSKKDVSKQRKKRDYKKWAKKWFKSGSNQIPPDVHNGFGPGKPLICHVCKEKVDKICSEFHNDKWVDRCNDCISNGIWTILKDENIK